MYITNLGISSLFVVTGISRQFDPIACLAYRKMNEISV